MKVNAKELKRKGYSITEVEGHKYLTFVDANEELVTVCIAEHAPYWITEVELEWN